MKGFLVFMVCLFLQTNHSIAQEIQKAEPKTRVEDSYLWNPHADGLTIGISLDETNGYIQTLIKNVSSQDQAFNTSLAFSWQCWRLEAKIDEKWVAIPYVEGPYRIFSGVGPMLSDNVMIKPGAFVLPAPLQPVPVMNKEETEHQGTYSLQYIGCPVPLGKEKANRVIPMTPATMTIDLLQFDFPEIHSKANIPIRMVSHLYIPRKDAPSSMASQKVVTPVVMLPSATLRELNKPDFSVDLQESKQKLNTVDVYLTNLTTKPITLKSSAILAHCYQGYWFSFEINAKTAYYRIKEKVDPVKFDLLARRKQRLMTFASGEKKLCTNLDLTLFAYLDENNGKGVYVPALIPGEAKSLLLHGNALSVVPSNELMVQIRDSMKPRLEMAESKVATSKPAEGAEISEKIESAEGSNDADAAGVAEVVASPDRSVQIVERKSFDRITLYAKLSNCSDVTLTLDATYTNMSPSRKLPLTIDIRKDALVRLISFRQLDTSQDTACHYHYEWKYGTRGKIPAEPVVCSLPYRGAVYPVSQGAFGAFSHAEGSPFAFAIDFALPEGTEVCAARAGKVIAFRADCRVGGDEPLLKDANNFIIIAHEDGTYGNYAHLQEHGVKVRLGEQVKVGQVIALSGNTGYSSGAHLHFDVFVPIDGRTLQTVPVRFRLGDGQVVEAREGDEL